MAGHNWSPAADPDREKTKMYDDTLNDGTAVVEFWRHITYATDGTVSGFTDTDLTGAVYAPVGGVSFDRPVAAAAAVNVTPVVTDQAADGTVTVAAGRFAVAVTNMSATGTVTVDVGGAGARTIEPGFDWEIEAPAGKGLAAVDIVVAGGGRAFITETPL